MWNKTGVALLIGLAAMIVAALMIGPVAGVTAAEWTGLREKTLWDWLAVLIIPLTVVLVGLVLTYVQSEDSRLAANSHNQEDALDAYLERMRLLMPELASIGSEITAITVEKTAANKPVTPNMLLALAEARANTLTVLRRLNGERKAIVLRYLAESNCLNRFETKVRLDGADAAGAKLANVDLRSADLARVDLARADLTGADLRGADLRGTNLTGAKWGGARLSLAMYDEQTQWPDGSLPSVHCGMIGPGGCLNPRLADVDFTSDLAEELDAAGLPQALRKRLQQKKLGVSRRAKVTVRKVEAEWDIVDGSKEFTIRKRQEKLWVGHEPDAELFARIVHGNCLRQANLRNIDLSGAMLLDANLCGADLRGAHLVEADLTGAEFDRDSKLQGARLTKADLTWANLEGVDLSNRTDLTYANLARTRFGGDTGKHEKWIVVSCLVSREWWQGTSPQKNFFKFDLEEAYLVGARFDKGTILGGTRLKGADLSGATLENVILHETDLTRATLSNANLRHATITDPIGLEKGKLDCADLRGATIKGNLAGADLRKARLKKAVLREANLARADLRGANMVWADLCGANLAGADLRGARLFRAKLQGAKLQGAKLAFLNLTRTEFTNAQEGGNNTK